MWPFGDEETVEHSNITTHDVISYSVDGGFILIAIVIIIAWKWRRNTSRLKSLEAASRRNNLNV